MSNLGTRSSTWNLLFYSMIHEVRHMISYVGTLKWFSNHPLLYGRIFPLIAIRWNFVCKMATIFIHPHDPFMNIIKSWSGSHQEDNATELKLTDVVKMNCYQKKHNPSQNMFKIWILFIFWHLCTLCFTKYPWQECMRRTNTNQTIIHINMYDILLSCLVDYSGGKPHMICYIIP